MGPRFKPVDRERGFLLPCDLRDWVPSNDIVHFTIEAAELVPVDRFEVNESGTGDERATHRDIAVRYICANRHTDHDTICTFRVRNKDAIPEAFLRILLLANEMKLLKVGTLSVDGSKIKANASIHKSRQAKKPEEEPADT